MITRLCIDNFRCFKSLSLPLGHFQMFVGSNGSGKSSVFDLLEKLRGVLLAGAPVHEVFRPGDCTRWDNRPEISVGMELRRGPDVFEYTLVLEFAPHQSPFHIREETLVWNAQPFYRFVKDKAELKRLHQGEVLPNIEFPFNSTRSFLAMIPDTPENAPVHRFRRLIGSWIILRLSPAMMNPYSKTEQSFLMRGGENFSSWYRSIVQSHPDVIQRLKETLSGMLSGFDQLSLQEAGEDKRLVAEFSSPSRHMLGFDELSDGQRALIVLYAVIHLAAKLKCDLFLDEPDNFVMPREIQPLLVALEDLTQEHGLQTVLVSHHPELLNLRGKSDGIRFLQRGDQPVEVLGLSESKDPSLPLAELMARGWEDD